MSWSGLERWRIDPWPVDNRKAMLEIAGRAESYRRAKRFSQALRTHWRMVALRRRIWRDSLQHTPLRIAELTMHGMHLSGVALDEHAQIPSCVWASEWDFVAEE